MGANATEIEKTRGLGGLVANWGIRAKILAALSAVVAVAVLIGVLAMIQMSNLDNQLNRVATGNAAALSDLGDIRGAQGDINHWAAMWYVDNSAEGQKRARDGQHAADGRIDVSVEAYLSHTTEEAGRVRAARLLADQKKFRVERDISYGDPVPAGYTPITDMNEFTTLIANIDKGIDELAVIERTSAERAAAEGRDAYNSAWTVVLISMIVGLAAAILLALLVAGRIVRPLRQITVVAKQMADGDLSKPAIVQGRDEVGQLGTAFNQARENFSAAVAALATTAQTLQSDSTRLVQVSDRLLDSTTGANTQATQVAAAADNVSLNLQTVATGAEELGSSIKEIAHSANEGANVASHAVEVAASTTDVVAKLGDSSAQIGNVVKVITSIAEQTNLLALNATIEAARAGDAGRGFAVVASEVKELAQETAKATEDIARKVEAIQSDTAQAVGTIGEISEIIAKINDYQLVIASAVEEQTATTNEMSRSIAEAASGSSQIAGSIGHVASATATASQEIDRSKQAAVDLEQLSAHLRELVAKFQI
ncbi:methyl-accepting chemotaxis protein [Actinokineospora cianjurensis]|uniref:Methyl-accepting chemotaxis protein n=1 Tax=Actinokineospora cianjurensis TaxID=585224 RepID=A0A421B1H6_9PSEU|nr:methyl-accepting chemotaxis protein [Actinokineospora cianjurensis]RLK58133.1 methyl-accepting chemotaxis protein [Actinokineospora cianjurensis]